MKRAFTLAEVMITFAIIGVIAMITLPAFINNVNKHVTITRLKRAYNMLSDSFEISNAMMGGLYMMDHNNSSTHDWFTNMLAENLHVTKSCADEVGCWNGGAVMRDGSKPYFDKGAMGIGDDNTTFITSNGFMINMDGYRAVNLVSKMGINSTADGVVMYIDLNREKRPNTVGRDIFVLTYTVERGLLPAGADKSDSEVNKNCKTTGLYCLEKIVRDDWSVDKLDL